MAKFTLVTQSSRTDDAPNYSSERLVNMYGIPGPAGAKGPMLLKSCLGRTSFATVSTTIMRRMEFVNNKIYAVSGARLWSIEEDGTATNLAAISDDVVTTISGNGDDIALTAGGNYYVLTGGTLGTVGGGRISNVGTVEFLDHYTIITEKNKDEFEWSELNDPSTRDALQFATNEADNLDTLKVVTSGQYAYFLGKATTEAWYTTGSGGADAFARVSGGVFTTGLLAENLVTKTETGMFMVGNDHIAYVYNGAGFQAVSTGAVSEALDEEDPTHCFYFEDRGQRFCCIRFANRPAWCYDMSTGLWHERSTGTALGAWDVVETVNAWNKWFCSTTDGVIYEMDRVNTDTSSPLMRRIVSPTLEVSGDQFSVSELELLGNFGESDIGRDAELQIRLSGDGGRTFGDVMNYSAGDLGDRLLRVKLESLGVYRNFAIEISMTDETDISIFSQTNVVVT